MTEPSSEDRSVAEMTISRLLSMFGLRRFQASGKPPADSAVGNCHIVARLAAWADFRPVTTMTYRGIAYASNATTSTTRISH